MVELLTVRAPKGLDDESRELLERCFADKEPDPKDIKAIRGMMRKNTGMASNLFDLAETIQTRIIDRIIDFQGIKQTLAVDIEEKRAALGYDQSPELEKLLIQDIISSWLFLQYLEWRMGDFMLGEHSMREGLYWERRLSAGQRRFDRACETLARIRKITRATMQINIAESGSQQVNIAGDVKR